MSKPPTTAQDDAFKRLRKKHRDAEVVGHTEDGGIRVKWTEPGGFGVRTVRAIIHREGRLMEVPQ